MYRTTHFFPYISGCSGDFETCQQLDKINTILHHDQHLLLRLLLGHNIRASSVSNSLLPIDFTQHARPVRGSSEYDLTTHIDDDIDTIFMY